MAHIAIFSNDRRLAERWQSALAAEYTVSIEDYASANRSFDNISNRIAVVHDSAIGPDLGDLATLSGDGFKILIIADNWAEDRQISAFLAGCHGFCATDAASTLLTKAVASLLKGDIWMPRHLAPRLIGMLTKLQAPALINDINQSQVIKNIELLTQREKDVAKMLGEGLSNKLIARTLNISERTVKAHLTSIFQKLDVQDRLKLVLLIKGHI